MVRPVLTTPRRQRQQASSCAPRNIMPTIFAICLAVVFLVNFFGHDDVGEDALHLTDILANYKNDGGNEIEKIKPRQQSPSSHSNLGTSKEEGPIKIAHAISLITCQRSDRVAGFLDALVILRHSIHQNSIHNNNNNARTSRYSYQMYAIIHPDGGCLAHVDLLQRLGYTPIIKPTPVNLTASLPADSWYRNHVESENCCGSKEFIKLYAYTLTDHPIVVHWDLDVLVLTPMDDLFDAMLYPANSPQGIAARQRLQIQRQPSLSELPDRIDAFFTRDITSARPWERITAVQGGFVVARPSLEHFQMYQDFISKGNYQPGRGPGSGWAGLGYGGFQGAMAYQGVLAFFYDHVYPGHHIELDVCHWNQVVADVIWRGPQRREEFHGKCRDYPPDENFADNTPEKGACHDCRVLPVDQTRTVHYTACKKPWECKIPFPRNPRDKSQVERLQALTNVTTCKLLFAEYFTYRRDIENKIRQVTGQEPVSRDGSFHPDAFLGYCGAAGKYRPITLPDSFEMKQVYGF